MLSHIRRGRRKKSIRMLLIIMTVVLSIGLIGSFAIMSAPSGSPQEGQPGTAASFDDLEERIDQYERAVDENPEDAENYINLGDAYYDFGVSKAQQGEDPEIVMESLKEALVNYEEALETRPDDLTLNLRVASTAFYTGEIDKAETYYERALDLEPEYPELLDVKVNYGQFLLYGKNDFEGAKEQWQEAIELTSDDEIEQAIESLIEEAEELERSYEEDQVELEFE